MSEVKKRSTDEIMQDYQKTAVKAGHLSFQIAELKKDQDLTISALRDLNFEALAAQRADAEAKAAIAVPEEKEEG